MANKPPQSHLTAGEPDPVVGLESDAPAASTSEIETLRREFAEFKREQSLRESRDAENTARLRRELEENQALVQRLLGEGQNIDAAALEMRWRNREEARRRIYRHVAGKKVIIQLHVDGDPRKNWPVHLALNGKVHNVPRGKPYEIEGEYLEVLDHAMVQTIAREVDEYGNRIMKVYDFFSYPYIVLRGLEGCDQGDIEASNRLAA